MRHVSSDRRDAPEHVITIQALLLERIILPRGRVTDGGGGGLSDPRESTPCTPAVHGRPGHVQ